MAETSVQVGKESTLVTIHQRNEDGPRYFFNDEVAKIKKGWLRYGAPKPSERVMSQIRDLIDNEDAENE